MADVHVKRDEFDRACEALWGEIEYQNHLPRRTNDSEATDVPGFLTLGQVYHDKTMVDWSAHVGDERALQGLRKLAAIYLRSMIYCGIRDRLEPIGSTKLEPPKGG